MKNKSIFWLILFALLAAAGMGIWALRGSEGTVATVWVDGELQERIDLSAVAVPYTMDVQTEWGSNRILVSPGQIAVQWSDCPEQICVRQGAIESSHIPITCLPHRLVIQIEEP